MSRRVAGNTFDKTLAARMEAIGKEFDHQADEAEDLDQSDDMAPPAARGQSDDEHT
jgi:hypothetical protein